MDENKTETYENALRQIAFKATKFKMAGEKMEKTAKDTLGKDDLWYIIEQIGEIAIDSLNN